MSKQRFEPALHALGLFDEFVTLCRTGCANGILEKWCKARPALMDATDIPISFKSFRERNNCSAPHGGLRPRGSRFYHVGSRKGFRV